MKILVIIPCYNEQDNIVNVVRWLQKEYPAADYLVVNDCSSDGSERLLKENSFNHISLPVNLGIGGGVQSGYLYAAQNGYDIAVQMDGDGQHNPKYLSAIIEPVANGELDCCIGSRFIDKEGFQTSKIRRFGIKFLSLMISALTSSKVLDVTSGFRACNKELTAFYAKNYAQDYPEPEAIISAVMNGFTIGERPVHMQERQSGVSSISPLGGAYYMVKVGLTLLIYRIIWADKRRRKDNANIPPILQVSLLICSVIYLLAILLLLKKGKLNVQYSIIWLGSAVTFIFFSAFPYLLAVLGIWLRVEIPSNLVFILLFAFVILLLLSLSTIATGFASKIKQLAQSHSILEKRVRELEHALNNADKAPTTKKNKK